GIPYSFAGATVTPATPSREIVWSINSSDPATTAAAAISNNQLIISTAGTVVVTGTVVNGEGLGHDVKKYFTITTYQPTYNINDIKAINAIIDAYSLSGWTAASAEDGTVAPSTPGTEITWSSATDNKRLEGLNLSGLNLTGNQLDLTKLTAMTSLDVSGNELTGLNVTGLTALTTLDCSGNKILDLDLSSCTALASGTLTGTGQSLAPITLTGISTTKNEAAISLTRQLGGLTTGITHDLSGSKLISTDYTITSTPFSIATGSAGNDLSGTLNLTYVRFYAVSGITSVPETAGRGVALTLVGAVEPDNASFQNIVWSVDNAGTTGATIGGPGNDVLSTTTDGIVVVKATIANGLSNDPADSPRDYTQTFSITVSAQVAATKVVIDQADPSSGTNPDVVIAFGDTTQLTAQVLDASDVLATDQTVTWSSSDETVAKVHPISGKVIAVNSGQTTITVTSVDGGHQASILLEVGSPVAVTGVSLNETTATIGADGTLQLTATVAPANASNKNVTWSSSDITVATVVNGLVTAVSTGTATITATSVADPTKTATCTITVDPPVAATSVTVSPNAANLGVGATQQLTATVNSATSGVPATNQNVTWSDGGLGFATVDVNGLVTAVAVGTETITATSADGGFTATATITVSAAVPVTAVSISPSTAVTLTPGATQTLTANLTPTNGTVTSIAWSSDNTAVASVDAAGIVTAGTTTGTATITVTVNGSITATKTITVSAAPTTYAVTVSSSGSGASGSGSYAAGATVSISAGTAPAGYQFSHWTASPSLTFANAGSPSTSFTMPANAVTVTAHFSAIPDPGPGPDPNPPTDPDLIDIYNAIDLVQYSTISIPQSSGNTQESVSQWLVSHLNALFAQHYYNVTVSISGFSAFEPAVAGSAANPKGTNGSAVFSATFSKGSSSVHVSYLNGRIVATTFTGNESAELQPLKAVGGYNALLVSGLFAGDDLRIYSMSGQLVYSTRVNATEVRVDLARGIYVVISGKRTVKASVR
ncbi:MAG: Ig-like domain-containing protein, partial [Tannerellaceae bacterium]|nr:Ig-like domain-containing protein [Tannerellaceae bacterium]